MDVKLQLPDEFAGTDIVLREGKAQDIIYPKQVYFECELSSLESYLTGRCDPDEKPFNAQFLDTDTTIILVNEDQGKITLDINPALEKGTKIIGKLSNAIELEQFNINKPVTFTRDQLVKLLRFNKRFFASTEKYETLLRSLSNLDLYTSAEINQGADTRGNKTQNFTKKVDSANVPTDFVLNVPVFKAVPPASIRVEIGLDVSENSVKFYLESPELVEFQYLTKTRIIKSILDLLPDFVILYQ